MICFDVSFRNDHKIIFSDGPVESLRSATGYLQDVSFGHWRDIPTPPKTPARCVAVTDARRHSTKGIGMESPPDTPAGHFPKWIDISTRLASEKQTG